MTGLIGDLDRWALDRAIVLMERFFLDPKLGQTRRTVSALGISCEELGEASGCSSDWMRRILNGKRQCGDRALARLKEAVDKVARARTVAACEAGKKRVMGAFDHGKRDAR